MRQSRPIVDGASLIGAAVTGDRGWQFVALDPRLDDIHGAAFPSAEEAERVARLVFARETGRHRAAAARA